MSASIVIAAAGTLTGGCSPEARRVRDGGPGGDPGNKVLIQAPLANPGAADTTLWPGRAPAPVDLLAAGRMAPPPEPLPTQTGPEQPAFTRSARDPQTSSERPRK